MADVRKSFRPGFIPKKRRSRYRRLLHGRRGGNLRIPGPNGAGKTTTIKCVPRLGLPRCRDRLPLRPVPLESPVADRLGFLPENPYFYDHLPGEFLDFYAQLSRVDKTERPGASTAFSRLVGLREPPNRRCGNIPGDAPAHRPGSALINEPEFVILDEPLGGLDPLGRKEIRDIILGLRKAGRTVLFTSHILQDIEMICDRVAIIVGGRILSQGRLSDLVSEKILFTEITLAGVDDASLADFGDRLQTREGRTLLKVFDETRVQPLLDLVRERGGRIHALVPRTQTLEDIFVDTVARR